MLKTHFQYGIWISNQCVDRVLFDLDNRKIFIMRSKIYLEVIIKEIEELGECFYSNLGLVPSIMCINSHNHDYGPLRIHRRFMNSLFRKSFDSNFAKTYCRLVDRYFLSTHRVSHWKVDGVERDDSFSTHNLIILDMFEIKLLSVFSVL